MSDQNTERMFINDSDLKEKVEVVITTLIDNGRKFTAYTVTTILRKRLPEVEIEHPRVRNIVRDRMFLSDKLRSGEWAKQDGVMFEDAKGPARLYYPVGKLSMQYAPEAPEVLVSLPSTPSQFEPL